MAITTSTFTVNAGWAKSSIITQMESAMTSLGWNDGTQTGQIIGLGTFAGGGTKALSEIYYDIRQKSTSGVGTDASFYVYRDTSNVRYVLVNRPGYGYTGGELVVLDGDSIGGISSGAADLSFKVCVNETLAGGTTGTASTIKITDLVTVNGIYKYAFAGNDRNGAIGAGQTIMVVNEGDVVSIANSNTNYGNSYKPTLALPFPVVGSDYNASSAAFGQIAGIAPTISLGTTSVFRPKIGQAGTYVFKNSNGSLGGIGHTLGQLVIQPWDGSGTQTPVGIGSTTTFWDKKLSGTYPWGVQKHQIQAGKRYGSTYRGFVEYTAGTLDIVTFNGYSSYSDGEYYGNTDTLNQSTFDRHGGTAEKRRIAGAPNLDFPGYYGGILDTTTSFEDGTITQAYARLAQINHGTNTGYILDLNLFKSGLDPRFVVFSYKSPNLSSTHLTSNTFDTWFFHNFTTNIWDLNHVFLGGLTRIISEPGNTTYPSITFRTYLTTTDNSRYSNIKRSAEFPYSEYRGYSQSSEENYVDWTVESTSYPQNGTPTYARMYYRSNDNPLGFSGYQDIDITPQGRISPDANFNAAIKGLPLNGQLLPVPYYMPDDFVLIQFHYTSASANIQQGDTITISGSEVYTVITGSYNQTTNTRGILFCARTV